MDALKDAVSDVLITKFLAGHGLYLFRILLSLAVLYRINRENSEPVTCSRPSLLTVETIQNFTTSCVFDM